PILARQLACDLARRPARGPAAWPQPRRGRPAAMTNGNPTFEKAMKMAVVCGLRAALGPALVSAAHKRPERQNLALAALGEMVLDKMPLMPSRASLPLMLPRAVAGAWVANAILEQ